MILNGGDKILVAHRRLFHEDPPRFFTGLVDRCDGDLVAVTGHTWVRDVYAGLVIRKDDPRTKIISLSSGTLIVYRLPSATELDNLKLEPIVGGQLVLTDGEQFSMDISESVRHED